MTEIVKGEQNTEINDELPVLFKLGLKALIKAKSDALIILRELELELINAKHDLTNKENEVILTTDFKDLGLTNDKLRNAYVNEKIRDYKVKIDVQKHRITSKKDDIEVMNDLIKLNELKLQGE